MLMLAALLVSGSIYLLLYQFRSELFGLEETHLPPKMFADDNPMALAQDRYTQEPDKTWMPLSRGCKDWEKRLHLPTAGLKRKLIKAGLPFGLWEFFAFKALALILVPAVSFILLGDRFPQNIVLTLSLALGFLLPEIWLKNKIKKRQRGIRRDLPNIIDLLDLCVGGGLDFMLAVNRVVKDLKPCDLTRELSGVYRETQMGKSRREALKNFAWRLDMPEVHSFVRTLVQADRMGTPMADALNLQSEEIRMRRFHYGEEMALKAPIKLLFPLFAFILPVVLIIVGGPILLQFVRGGMNLGF